MARPTALLPHRAAALMATSSQRAGRVPTILRPISTLARLKTVLEGKADPRSP
jgi:hypothetical protein